MKKWLSLTMIMVMMLSLFGGWGTSVQAEPVEYVAVNTATIKQYWDLSEALNEATDGQTIQLIANVSTESNIAYDRTGVSVTLDLNGFNLTRDAYGLGGDTQEASTIFAKAGTLTIQDSSAGESGYIKYVNSSSSGSGLNVGQNGKVKLLSGGIIGAGQGVFAHDPGAQFEMSGGVVYGYFDADGSEALDAGMGAYVTVSGGYLGTYNKNAALIWSGSTLDPQYWSITGGYFTSNYYNDGAQNLIQNFVTDGVVTELIPTVKHAMSGDTEYRYHLTTPRKITFDASGGQTDTSSLKTNGSGKLETLPLASREDLTFKGWYTARTGGTKITTDYIFNTDTVVYAQYSEENLEKETKPAASINYIYESLQGLAPGAIYLVNNNSITADSSGEIAIDESWFNTTLSIVKQGVPGNTQDSDPQELDIPARPKTPSVGHTDEATLNGKDGTITLVDSTMEYKSRKAEVWGNITGSRVTNLKPNEYIVRIKATETSFKSDYALVDIKPLYPIEFYLNDGTILSGDVKGYHPGIDLTLPTQVSLTGARFAGWYRESDFSGEPITQISSGTEGKVKLYAKWTNSFTFYYNDGDRNVYDVQDEVLHGGTLTMPEPPTRDGYTFVGWYKDTALTKPWQLNEQVSADTKLYARWEKQVYSIEGTVINDANPFVAVPGAQVKVVQGNVQFGSTAVTDANGHFMVTGVPNGTYNLVVTKGDQLVTLIVVVKGGNFNFGDQYIILPEGKKNTALEVKGTNTPSVVVDKLNDLFNDSASFTAEDKTQVDLGGAVKFKLTVEKQEAGAAVGASSIQAIAGNRVIDMYLDMSLFKTLTDSVTQNDTTVPLPTLGKLLKIIVPVDLTGKNDVVLYRYHEGTAAKMNQLPYSTTMAAQEGFMIDPTDKELTIFSQNFSTYAIAYSNGSNGGNTGGGAGGSSGGAASSGVSYTVTVTGSQGGTISPNGTVKVAQGASQTFLFTPQEGYIVADVLVDGVSVGAVSSYTLSQVKAAHSIQVVFAKKQGDTQNAANAGLPYYYTSDNQKLFIGFAADDSGMMKYIAPSWANVLFQPNPKAFTDIAGHWGASPIQFVTEREIFLGTGKQQFSPNTGMTRAMLATVIGRMYERSYGPLETKGTRIFTDTQYDSWYGAYIDWAYQNGIIQGVGGGKFEPNRTVTRQELAAMFYRFADFLKLKDANTLSQAQLTYSDASSIAAWAEQAAMYMQETGIMTGRAGATFAPKNVATRAEVAAMFKRFIEHVL
ncbi:InlB B-repeat-containing protein [Paenibacillus barcinonensis]|nr:InlB B-repeat-containing protein [Paenibacillus barcinonensis]